MIKAIVTDIEGTTSSIDFVHKQLFPYARQHMADFVRTHAEQPEVHEQLEAVRRELGDDHLPLEGAPHQHHRYPGPRGLHRRSGALSPRP